MAIAVAPYLRTGDSMIVYIQKIHATPQENAVDMMITPYQLC
jgi:hypothetical protein